MSVKAKSENVLFITVPINDTTDLLGYDWMYDFEFQTPRLLKRVNVLARVIEAPDEHDNLSARERNILKELKELLEIANHDQVAFLPE